MSIIRKMLKQKAVYWPLLRTDQNGMPTWDTPHQVSCRWEDTTQEQMTQEGEIQQTQEQVYVSEDVVIGGYLALGTLTSSTNPDPRLAGGHKITGFNRTPNFRATEFLRLATLGR